jgi:polar amino acid transport system substrate-binding protein
MELSEAARTQLAPGGRIRAAIAVGETISAVWCRRDGAGVAQGVPVDLARALGEWAGLEVELVAHDSSGHIVRRAIEGAWDVAFLPVDAERKKHVLFGANYYLGTSTYGVRTDDPARDVTEIDRPGARILGVEGTATLRSARRTLARAKAEGVGSLNEAITRFRAGEADAIALGRDSLENLAAGELPGLRVLEGHFHATGTAAAVPLGHEAARDAIIAFIEETKQNGALHAILAAHGMPTEAAAPRGSFS